MYRTAALLACVVLVWPAAAGASYEDLVEAYKTAEAKWQESTGADPYPDYSDHPISKFLPKMRSAAEDMADSPRSAEPLTWMMLQYQAVYGTRADGDVDTLAWAVDTVTENHAGDAAVGAALPQLKDMAYAVQFRRLMKFYKAILATSSDNEVKAQATFNMAYALYDDFGPVSGKHPLRQIRYSKDAKKLFGQMSKEFAGTIAAAEAEPFLFEIEHLQIGKRAPEMLGIQPDGTEIRLSQFEGQVVVLDFWGFW